MLRAVRGGQPMDREYIGIDLHKSFFQACVLTATGQRRWEGRFARTPEGVAAQMGVGGALDNRRAGGCEVVLSAHAPPTVGLFAVVDPRKATLKAGFAAKTDRLDARRLADARR